MEQICPNCGTTNRGTSRFCARCGQTLPQLEGDETEVSEGSLNLPWLQAVQDKAVQRTSSLGPEEVKEQVSGTPSTAREGQPEGASASQPSVQPLEAAAQAPGETQPPAQTPAQQPEEGGNKNEPPPPWVVGILEPQATPTGPEQGYEPEELSHIMPWAHGKEGEGESAPPAPESSSPGLPPWLGDVTVQETVNALPPSEQKVTEPVEINLEGIEPFVPPTDEALELQKQPDEVPTWLRSVRGAPQPEPAHVTQPSLHSSPVYRNSRPTILASRPPETCLCAHQGPGRWRRWPH